MAEGDVDRSVDEVFASVLDSGSEDPDAFLKGLEGLWGILAIPEVEEE